MEPKEVEKLNREIKKIAEENRLEYNELKELIKGSEFDEKIIKLIEQEEYSELQKKVKIFLEERKLEYEDIKRNIEDQEIKRISEKTGLKYEVVEKMLDFDLEFHGGYKDKDIRLVQTQKDGRNILKINLSDKKNKKQDYS